MATKIKIPVLEYTVKPSNSRQKDPTISLPAAAAVSDAEITALFNAINAIVLGSLVKSALVVETDKDSGTATRPANAEAQKEKRWRAKYTDSVTGEKGSFELPTADYSQLAGGSDLLDLTGGVGLALKSAAETAMVSRDGNALTIDSVEVYTRN